MAHCELSGSHIFKIGTNTPLFRKHGTPRAAGSFKFGPEQVEYSMPTITIEQRALNKEKKKFK